MNLGERAFRGLYGKAPDKKISLKYHAGFSGYNANVKMTSWTITFSLSRKLEACESEIQIGVMQELLNKLYKTKIETDEQNFYHSFVRKMSDLAPVTDVDDDLARSFERVNEEYFSGMMSQPNLVWGNRTRRILGTYTYASDTITISLALKDAPDELLDYVMYHEMLHKKHKFSCSSGRTHSHTPAFKKDEAKFKLPKAEEQLNRWLRLGTKPRKESSFVARVMGWGNN